MESTFLTSNNHEPSLVSQEEVEGPVGSGVDEVDVLYTLGRLCFPDGKPDFRALNQYLMEIFHPLALGDFHYLFEEDTGIYTLDDNRLNAAIKDIAYHSSFRGKLKPIFAEMQAQIFADKRVILNNDSFDSYRGIPCKNGVLTFSNDGKLTKFERYRPDMKFRRKLAVSYDPEATPDLFIQNLGMTWLDEEDVEKLFLPLAGALLQSFPGKGAVKRAWLIRGGPDSGKTTFLDFLAFVVGSENVSRVSLQRLCDEANRFDTYSLVGKVLNMGDDLSESGLQSPEAFKSLTGAISHRVEKKNKDPVSARITCTNIFTCNAPPKVPKECEFDVAYWSRWTILDFQRYHNRDPSFKGRVFTEEMASSFLSGVIQTIQKYWSEFPAEDAETVREKWLTSSSPLLEFMAEETYMKTNGFIPCEEFRQKLSKWVNDSDLEPSVKKRRIQNTPHDPVHIGRALYSTGVPRKERMVTDASGKRVKAYCYIGIAWKNNGMDSSVKQGSL